MSRKMTYTCDRCKQESPDEVRSFDFGKDYSQEIAGVAPRIIVDLCRKCWNDLAGFLRGQKA